MLMRYSHLFCAMIALTLTTPCRSEVFAAVPHNSEEYERIFGYKPMGNELETARDASLAAHVNVFSPTSLDDFSSQVRNGSGLLILVGHNENGDFKFASGESVPLSELADTAHRANRLVVFLTCKVSSSIDAPGTRLKTTFKDAFALAGEIEHRYGNFTAVVTPSTPVVPDGATGPHVFSSPALSSPQCLKLFSGIGPVTQVAATKYMAVSRDIQRIIYRAEAKKVIESTVKIGGGIMIPGVILVYVDERG